MKLLTKNILTKDDRRLIADVIRTIERDTIGEIKVNIQKRRSRKDNDLSVYDLALKNFFLLEMDKTRRKTGILIFILLSEHTFQIIGDSGMNEKVGNDFWEILAGKMSEYFRREEYCAGITFVLREMGAVLKKEFPSKPGDINEISNEVVIT